MNTVLPPPTAMRTRQELKLQTAKHLPRLAAHFATHGIEPSLFATQAAASRPSTCHSPPPSPSYHTPPRGTVVHDVWPRPLLPLRDGRAPSRPDLLRAIAQAALPRRCRAARRPAARPAAASPASLSAPPRGRSTTRSSSWRRCESCRRRLGTSIISSCIASRRSSSTSPPHSRRSRARRRRDERAASASTWRHHAARRVAGRRAGRLAADLGRSAGPKAGPKAGATGRHCRDCRRYGYACRPTVARCNGPTMQIPPCPRAARSAEPGAARSRVAAVVCRFKTCGLAIGAILIPTKDSPAHLRPTPSHLADAVALRRCRRLAAAARRAAGRAHDAAARDRYSPAASGAATRAPGAPPRILRNASHAARA